MTQRQSSHQNSLRPRGQRSLLMQGLGWLGGVSLLSSSVAIAQTSPTPEAEAVPSAQDLLLSPGDAAPAQPAPAQPAAVPELQAAPAAEAPASQSESPVVDAAPAVSEPAASEPLVSPDIYNSAPSTNAQPSPTVNAPDSLHIDPTSYSVGATQSGDQPEVVLSERSTGCQTVLRQGQSLPASLCTGGAAIARSSGSSNLHSIRMGPVSLRATGISAGSTTPSVRDYFNVTPRPTSFMGNGNTRLMFPLSIPAAITSAFGWRVHPITGQARIHSGTDLGAPMGTPILAAFAGRVAIADFMRGYGLTVVLQHDNATKESLYAHMSEVFVRPGEWVEQGAVIGRVGSTGLSTGPHLHFELRELTSEGWTALDPGELLNYALANWANSPVVAQLAGQPERGTTQLINWAIPSLKGVALDVAKKAKQINPDEFVPSDASAQAQRQSASSRDEKR